ncbi:MAG: OmpA family protein [Bdellovibrio bacteriovorus]
MIWLVLIAGLGLYGWFAGSRQPPDAETAVEASRAPDAAGQGEAAETAVLQRQLADAKGRIAALEETLHKERRRAEAPPKSNEAPPSKPSLAAQVVELGGRQTGQGLMLGLAHADLTFPIGTSNLPSGDLPILDRIAALLEQHPTASVRVEGHTDSSGRDDVNLRLSRERAETVRQALVDRGVAAERIAAIGYGASRPIADNGTREGRDRNRRIEIYLIEGPR